MARKKYSFTFDPNKKGLRKILGDLETDIMEILWARGELTVRQVYDLVKEDRGSAYTTVMTVMSRLAEKGLLEKAKQGQAFLYRTTSTRDEFTVSSLGRVIRGLLQDFTTPAISQFLESIDDLAPETIDELSRLIEEKRKKKNV